MRPRAQFNSRRGNMPQPVVMVSKLADTNPPGVAAIKWSREALASPLSHSESIASELLGGPLAHAYSRSASIRQRRLRQECPTDSRIVLHFYPYRAVRRPLIPTRP